MSLEAKNLSCGYRCFSVLKDISFKAEYGNLVFVLGKNGSGKSTLFKSILSLLPYAGTILADGIDIQSINTRELAQKIAYVPQNHSAAFGYSVLDMVLMGTTARLKPFLSPGEEQIETAKNALSAMNIEHLTTRSFSHISGGEQRLVLIARAIAQKARILIMDEPCANLDYGNSIRVMEQIKKLAATGYLVIQSTHSPDQAFLFADQVLVLYNGSIDRYGAPDAVLDEELIKKLYGIPVQLIKTHQDNMTICMPIKQ